MTHQDASIWVFGYGSLMWNPGFPHVERQMAVLEGWHRALCIYSHVHRGTPERPGLVLGLDQGGSCHGVAFRVAPHEAEPTLAYLRARELVTHVYLERTLPIRLEDGKLMNALAYVVDRSHAQYAGRLPHTDLLRLIRQGHGLSGRNADYVLATHQHLEALGVPDDALAQLSDELAASGP